MTSMQFLQTDELLKHILVYIISTCDNFIIYFSNILKWHLMWLSMLFFSSKYMRTECLNSRYAYDQPLPVAKLVSLIGSSILGN